MKKFGLSGAHSTGKSTLIRNIESKHNSQIKITPEAPRVLVEEMENNEAFQRSENTLAKQMIIFAKHMQQEISSYDCDILLTDRTLVDHWAYTEVLHGASEEYKLLRKAIKNIVSRHCDTFEKFMYIPIEFRIEDDGVRENDEAFQIQIDEKMRQLYKELNIEIHEIRGVVTDRYNALIANMGVEK